jgi:hypothetical protein
MKAVLKYDLPEERLEFEDACRATDYKVALHNLDQELRAALKHDAYPEWDRETVDKIRTKLWQLIAEHNITLD